jgi:hypothetical protein
MPSGQVRTRRSAPTDRRTALLLSTTGISATVDGGAAGGPFKAAAGVTAPGVMRQRPTGLGGAERSIPRDLLWIHDEHLDRGADFPAMRGRRARRPQVLHAPSSSRPLLAIRPDAASTRAAAAPTAVALPVADSSGHGAERRRVADHVDARGLLLDAWSGSRGADVTAGCGSSEGTLGTG